MRRAAVLLVGCTLAMSATVARAEGPLDGTKTGAAFVLTDRNEDRRIDRAEFQRRMADIFYFRDLDRDGFLVMAELGNVTPEAFKAADHDGDGKLSFYEYIDSRFRDFDRADANDDGLLSPEEVESR